MLALLAITTLANVWGVPSLNDHLIPQMTHTTSEVLEREASHKTLLTCFTPAIPCK